MGLPGRGDLRLPKSSRTRFCRFAIAAWKTLSIQPPPSKILCVGWRSTLPPPDTRSSTPAKPTISVARVAPSDSGQSRQNIFSQPLAPLGLLKPTQFQSSPRRQRPIRARRRLAHPRSSTTSAPCARKSTRASPVHAPSAEWLSSAKCRPLRRASSTPARCIPKSCGLAQGHVRFAAWRSSRGP